MTCSHTLTNRDGYCIDCGVRILAVEPRPCGQCAHYRPESQSIVGICRLHQMAASVDMHVTFKVVNGTCFRDAGIPYGIAR